jgi:DnaJ-class molecular chaperone
MSDYYNTLGISKQANADEIKKAYRKLASQHHPDKGGDTKKFQEIEEAYRTLSDPEKRSQYDNPAPQGFQQFGGMPPGFEDIMSQMFGGGNSPFGDVFGGRRQQQRNRTLNIQTEITLEEAFHGKDLLANLVLPSGKNQTIEVKIPRGVQDGTVLRLAQMGDDSFQNMPRGDIHLSIRVRPHNIFERHGDDLIRGLEVNAIDAILGKTYYFETIDNKELEVKIHPGTQHGQMLSAPGYGMPAMSDNRFVGRLLIKINIKIPTNLTQAQLQKLKEIYN